uniref:Uncharacterized protein K0023E10.37 n=1 Tax=Oryza sativa subsp. indica TaxID=39946 RepID=C8TEV3_ORYSI|nr:hypothetical protein [Oryza sativa Indica Group]
MANGRRTGSVELVGSAEPKNVSSRPLLWPVLTVRYYDLRTVNNTPTLNLFSSRVKAMDSTTEL